MKRIILVMCLILGLSFSACSSGNKDQNPMPSEIATATQSELVTSVPTGEKSEEPQETPVATSEIVVEDLPEDVREEEWSDDENGEFSIVFSV